MATALVAVPDGIKQVRLSWSGAPADATVVVQENLDGQSGFADKLSLPAGATVAQLSVLLPTRWGAQYRLKTCWALDCQESEPVGLGRALDGAVAYLKPAAPGANAHFGAAVAVSGDGSTLAVGAPGSRAVEVWVRDGSAWRQQAVLAAPVGVNGHWGASLAVSGNGSVLAVGAPHDQAKGHVVVWSRAAQTWSRLAILNGSGTGEDGYGAALALSSDGDRLAVGAPRERQGGVASGAAYVYGKDSAGWRLVGRLGSPAPQWATGFGTSLALSANGTGLVVGAPEADDGLGVAHLYALGVSAFNWSTSLVGARDQGSRHFGHSVAWAERDGVPWMAVGAPCVLSLLATPCAGDVHVWRQSSQGTSWVEHAVLQATEPRQGDLFGYSLSLSADALVLSVGVPNDAGSSRGIGLQTGPQTVSGSGAAFVFRRTGEQWMSPVAVKAPNARPFAEFGRSVALAADGETLAVGAPWDASAARGIDGDSSDDSRLGRGAAYLY